MSLLEAALTHVQGGLAYAFVSAPLRGVTCTTKCNKLPSGSEVKIPNSPNLEVVISSVLTINPLCLASTCIFILFSKTLANDSAQAHVDDSQFYLLLFLQSSVKLLAVKQV